MIDIRNAISYFVSIAVTLFFFIVAIGYIILAISVNAGRTSDLALVDASIQASAAQLAKTPSPEDVLSIRRALSDLNAQKVARRADWRSVIRRYGFSQGGGLRLRRIRHERAAERPPLLLNYLIIS